MAKNPSSREEGGEGGICAQITMNAVYAVVLFNWWQVYEGSSNISSRATHTTYIRIDLRLMMISFVMLVKDITLMKIGMEWLFRM